MKYLAIILVIFSFVLTGSECGGDDSGMIKGNYVLDNEMSHPDELSFFKQYIKENVTDFDVNNMLFSFTKNNCYLKAEIMETYPARYVNDNGTWYVECLDGSTVISIFRIVNDNQLEVSNSKHSPTYLFFKRVQ